MLTEWKIDFGSGVPIYKQIENLLYYAIGNGSLREGDRLPTIKDLADRFKINPNTVAKAYRELDLKGVITGRRGDGSFVSAVTGLMAKPNAEQRAMKLDELVGRLVAEAKAFGITEEQLLDHITARLKSDE